MGHVDWLLMGRVLFSFVCGKPCLLCVPLQDIGTDVFRSIDLA